jgi:hypothetical protein
MLGVFILYRGQFLCLGVFITHCEKFLHWSFLLNTVGDFIIYSEHSHVGRFH